MDLPRAVLNALTFSRVKGRSMMVLRKAHRATVNQGGTADIDLFVLDRISVKDVFCIQ